MLQTPERLVTTDAERYLLVYMVVVLVVITAIVVLFFVIFIKRKNKLLLERIKREKAFEEELSKTQTEIVEQTLKNIGWELHDNVGQLLAVASMQLNFLCQEIPKDIKEKLKDTNEIVRKSLKEVRSLSKSLNNEVILNIGFEQSITNELDRIKRLKYTEAELHTIGSKVKIQNKKHEIIIFRILQEFFSNSVKYSEAKKLVVTIHYYPNRIKIVASDDGVGFDIDRVEKGSGLINMKSRAALIQAKFKMEAKHNQGVKLTLDYPFN